MKKVINVITLGCSKNVVDSEHLMNQIDLAGYKVIHDSHSFDAKTVIINTCGFIKDAKEESIDTILQFIQAKEKGKIDQVFVMGCLSQRYKNELSKEIPDVDEYFGVNDLPEVLNKIGVHFSSGTKNKRYLSTPKHFAYLKISEGCDRSCSFCAIPLIRGKHVSVPMQELIDEARSLAEKGVKELILIAQDLSYYGIDIAKKQLLPELLSELEKIEGIEWIRLHYLYPDSFPERIIPLIQQSSKICHYIDMPIQHINDDVLKSMKRGHNREKTEHLLNKLKELIPDIAIRTTILTGFPTETKKAFDELIQFITDYSFDRLGVFTYSEEEDTSASINYKDHIPQKEKASRAEKIMKIQELISYRLNQQKVGNILKVIIDDKIGDTYIARSQYDSPEVDNEIHIHSKNVLLQIGEFYNVRIDSAAEFDLTATIVK